MMRSLFSGVAGLKTHQTKMDVIGNNIANVNTTAYKSSSIVFSDLMSQTTQRASGPNAANGTGGTNARQIGLGVKSGAINMNIEGQGSAQSTGNPFDIMITGDNFFVVSNGSGYQFTRDGSFYVDGAGNLAMTSTGYNVMGWLPDTDNPNNIKQDTVTALRIMSAEHLTYEPEATSKAYMSGIIDSNDTDVTSSSGKAVNLSFYDAQGYSYTAKLVFKQSTVGAISDPKNYSIEVDRIIDSTGKELDISALQFGNQNTTQAKETTLALNTKSYQWNTVKDADGNVTTVGKTLQTVGGEDVVNILDLFDGSGNLKALDDVVKVYDNDAATVQDALDEIAKAYGYEGSTDEFLKLYVNADDGTAVNVESMLANLSQMNGTDYTPGIFPTNVDSFTADGRYYDGIDISFDGSTGKFAGLGGSPTQTTATLALSLLGGNFSDIEIDFSTCVGYDNKGTSTVGATKGDLEGLDAGRPMGTMIGISIQQNGMIYASYDSGMTKLLGQIATANFPNASGLEKLGDNLYTSTLNSGEFNGTGVDVTAGGGKMTTGQLEMSNVDLSYEFTEMITTQRGFQANSRIITVSDTLLEELTNLKR